MKKKIPQQNMGGIYWTRKKKEEREGEGTGKRDCGVPSMASVNASTRGIAAHHRPPHSIPSYLPSEQSTGDVKLTSGVS